MAYIAHNETTDNGIMELPLIGTKLVELPDGRVVDFHDPIDDTKYGRLKYANKIIQTPDPAPQPFNPARAQAIRELHETLEKYPSDYYPALLTKYRKMANALDHDFPAAVTVERIQEWKMQVDSEAEERRLEKIRETPPPTFSQFQLTRNFYHSRFNYGQLKIIYQEPVVRGSLENCWKAEWTGLCAGCGHEGPVSSETLLFMECGYLPLHSCSRPCR